MSIRVSVALQLSLIQLREVVVGLHASISSDLFRLVRDPTTLLSFDSKTLLLVQEVGPFLFSLSRSGDLDVYPSTNFHLLTLDLELRLL